MIITDIYCLITIYNNFDNFGNLRQFSDNFTPNWLMIRSLSTQKIRQLRQILQPKAHIKFNFALYGINTQRQPTAVETRIAPNEPAVHFSTNSTRGFFTTVTFWIRKAFLAPDSSINRVAHKQVDAQARVIRLNLSTVV